MDRVRVCLAVACLILVGGVTARAQAAQSNTPTFTSTTDLVLIPTIVHDKSGIHIPGLTKEAFELKQDGKSHPIAIFEEVKTDSTALHRSQGEQGTFTNFENTGSRYRRLNIIVLDFVNTPFADQANARNQLVKFLSEVAASGEPMCLLALTRGGLKMLHDFTDDPKLLAQEVRKVNADTAPMIHESVVEAAHPPAGDGIGAALTRMIRDQLQAESQLASMETKDAASLTVMALRQIAKAFHGLPGRKALIWASSGFPFSISQGAEYQCDPPCDLSRHSDMQSVYDNLWKMMNDAQIAIYSVDLRSAASGVSMSTGGVRPSDIGDPQFDTNAQEQWKRQDTDSTLQTFAENTGGKSFLGGSNLVESFRQATQDDSSYYMLGYYVNRSGTKTGWHQISVTIKRKGVHPRFRNGFFLSNDASTTSARGEIQLALLSPLDFVGIPISISWSGQSTSQTPGKTKVQFDLVMPANFASVDEPDQNHMVVDIAAVARNAKGEIAGEVSQRIDTHLKPDGLAQIQHNGLTYHNGLQLAPGEYTVRFVVRDSLGNRVGSVAAPVKVP